MGIITRFRARLHSLQALAKLDPQLQAEKTAQTVCLLSVVLLLPYFARCQASIVAGLGYSCLVLPMVVSANYRYPVSALKAFALQLAGWGRSHAELALRFLGWLYGPLDRLEKAFIRLSNIFTLTNQLVFFVQCDRLLVPGQPVTYLYTLMFYNVLAYCVGYVRELVEKEDWSPYVHMAEHSNIKHLAMSATKIVLEWTKAVTFVVTAVFMLLVFSLERGLEHYEPTALYTVLTFAFYAATERTLAQLILAVVARLQLPSLEGLEPLWVGASLRGLAVALSLLLAAPLLLVGRPLLACLALYANVHLRCKEMRAGCLRELAAERAVLDRYRHATRQELDEFDDICAVCLSPMALRTGPRVTPCHHIFHSDCLRQCLKASDQCPICKRQLKFD